MKIALVAIGRRENRYAREWVEHYLELGFDHIYICDNNHDGEEYFEDVLGDRIAEHKVSIHDYRNRQGVQVVAYNEMYRQYGGQYDWMAFFDFDEFLTVNSVMTVKQWLAFYTGTDADTVLVNWKCYGDCGQVYDDGRGVKERFTEPLPLDKAVQYDFPNNNHIKSIVRGGLGEISFGRNPHIPDTARCCYTATWQPCEASPFQPYDFNVATLHHYATKTIEEWMMNKWTKGTGNKPDMDAFRKKYKGRFFKYNEATPEKQAYMEAFERNKEQRITVCIVHYNTPEMTRCCIRSLQKHTPGVGIIVFDNSDKLPFEPMDGVEVIDNTKGQIINFDEWLKEFPDKVDVGNGWASAKHCWTVQWLVNKRRNPFILMDSDVLIKQDISSFWDKTQAFVGQVKPHMSAFRITVERVLPFLCFVNVPMMKEEGVSYFNFPKMWALTYKSPDKAYDTGCWFLEDVRRHGLPRRELSIDPYALHFGHGSWKGKDPKEWLEEHKALWA